MNICVIFYSETGFTKKFANVISDSLKSKGHRVEQIEVQTDIPVDRSSMRKNTEISIKNLPDCSSFDLIMFGGPVWGFQSNPVTIRAAEKCSGIEGKSVIPFVTHLFPYPFLGGKSAASQISKILSERGAKPFKPIILSRAWHDFDKEAEKKANEVQVSDFK